MYYYPKKTEKYSPGNGGRRGCGHRGAGEHSWGSGQLLLPEAHPHPSLLNLQGRTNRLCASVPLPPAPRSPSLSPPRPSTALLCLILLVSRHEFQVVGGCDVVVSSKLQQHLLGILSHRPVHGDKDLGHLLMDLRPATHNNKQRRWGKKRGPGRGRGVTGGGASRSPEAPGPRPPGTSQPLPAGPRGATLRTS